MEKHKVLVLLATYNGEKYLQEQLNSLYRQEGVEVCILAHDDGSTDATCKILNDNAKGHNLEWYEDSHNGVQNSFFSLMRKALNSDAEYFAFCDQDDIWDDDKLSVALIHLQKENNNLPLLYYCGQRLIDSNGRFIENHRLNQSRSLKTRFILSDFAGCTGVFNKNLLNAVVSFCPKYMLMHDTWILRVCLCLGGRVIVDSEPHIGYRQHEGNTIGLGHGLKATLTQVKNYLFKYKVEELTNELVRGYGNKMTPEYKELSKWICKYKNNCKYKRKLLKRENIDFCAGGLNIVYRLKVLLGLL